MSETRWLPPTGGPENPTAPIPMARQGPPPPPPGTTNGPSGVLIAVGIVAVLLGVAAVGLSESLKLDAEKVLTGGVYIKDGYRAVMTASGVALIVLGALLVLLAALNVSRGARTATAISVAVLSAVVILEGALLLAAISARERGQEAAEPFGY